MQLSMALITFHKCPEKIILVAKKRLLFKRIFAIMVINLQFMKGWNNEFKILAD